MIILLLFIVVLFFIVLFLVYSFIFKVQKPIEHYRMCAKLPSMQRGYLADFKLTLQLAMLRPKGC